MKRRLDVVFLHPDLGIGGAERLAVDAAVAAQECGHRVRFVTNHHDPAHCFDETRDGTVPVTVVGGWLPRTVLSRCYALCSYARMIYAAFYVAFVCSPRPDVVFVDQVSACVPVLRWRSRVVFYCHYPDQLLSGDRACPLKRAYRAPLDRLEEATVGLADVLLVNSRFTLSVFRDTFRRVRRLPDVLYPSINTAQFDRAADAMTAEDVLVSGSGRFILSLNRYERKKNVALAVRAIRLLPERHRDVRLVVAGGYDLLNAENVEHYMELKRLARNEGVSKRVTFLQSPSDAAKTTLLRDCECLVYTPAGEHFGIVPLEAMYCGRPVVAANSGGPTETVVDGCTGFLCDPEPERFADAITRLLDDGGPAEQFGAKGRQRFDDVFSFAAFKRRIEDVLDNAYGSE